MGFLSTYIIASALILSTASQIHTAERQAKAQRRSLRDQSAAQDQALAQATRQERQSAEAIARANRKTPDIGAMLAGQLATAAAGGNRATTLRPPALGGAQMNLDPLAQMPTSGQLLGE